MRLLRLLAVLIGDALDRLRTALLSWAGVDPGSGEATTDSVDDRPAPWLDYIRARAPWLVAGKRRLPSGTVPRIEPTWPQLSRSALGDTIPRKPGPSAAGPTPAGPPFRAPIVGGSTNRPATRTTEVRDTEPAPRKEPGPRRPAVIRVTPDPARAMLDWKATQPIGGMPAPSTPRVTAPRRIAIPPASTAALPPPSPTRQDGERPPVTIARPSEQALPPAETAWPRWAEWSSAPKREDERPAMRPAPQHEPEGWTWLPEPDHVAAAPKPQPHVVDRTDNDDGLWVDLPDRGMEEWQVQSNRSLIREQLHFARLLAEQVGSSWSALHS